MKETDTLLDRYYTIYHYTFDDTESERAPELLLAILRKELTQVKMQDISLKPVLKKFEGKKTNKVYEAQCYPDILSVTPPDNQSFWFTAEYDEGILHLDTRLTKGKRAGVRRDKFFPRFHQLVGISLEYFAGIDKPIVGIYGAWPPKVLSQENSNYKIMKSALDDGIEPEEAAFLTPTGRVAKSYGFQFAVIPKYKFDDSKEKGYEAVFFKTKNRTYIVG